MNYEDIAYGADKKTYTTLPLFFVHRHNVHPYQRDGSRSHKNDGDELTKPNIKRFLLRHFIDFFWKKTTKILDLFLQRIGISCSYSSSTSSLLLSLLGNHVRNELNHISELRCEQSRINYWKSKQISDWCPS